MASKPRDPKPGWKLAAKTPRLKRPWNVVPWQSKAEWDQVMVGLYCEDCQTQRDALDRVSVWKSRFGSKMPLAVECTADLIRCKLLDASGVLKSHELILTYGLALVRFVNLITERRQKMVTVPLRHLAKELNIPIWIVDLRHDLTHGTLPQLVTCRKGCEAVLDWLRRSYWSCQLGNSLVEEGGEETEESSEAEGEDEMDSSQEDPEKTLDEQKKHQELCGKVRDVLTSFKNQQLEVLQQQPDVNQACKMWSTATSEVEWVVAQMKDLLQENREVVAKTLLEEGFLIPTADTLQILNIHPQETHKWDFKIPRAVLRFWQPLLGSLHSTHFTQTLLEKMFNDLKAHARISSLRSQYLISWITKILNTNLRVKKTSSQAQQKRRCLRLFHHYVSLQWLKLLRDCLDAPCWASPHLLHLILLSMEPPLPAEAQEKLLYLTSIYTQEDGSFPSSGSTLDVCKQPVYTVESLLKLNAAAAHKFLKKAGRTEVFPGSVKEKGLAGEEEEEEEEEMETQPFSQQEPLFLEDPAVLAERRKALEGGLWQVGSVELKWRHFPLGKLPDQTDDPDTLLVDNYTTMSALDQLENEDRKNSSNISSEWSGFLTAGLLWTQSELHKLKSGIQLF